MKRRYVLVMGTEDLFKSLRQILQQMKAIADLHRIRWPLPDASSIGVCAISGHGGHFGMCLEPVRHSISQTVCQHVNGAAASQEALRDTLVSLLAEVARNYIEVRGLQRRLAIAQENITAQQETLELTRARFNAGLTSELDVVQAASQLATTQSQMPALETSLKQGMHRLGVLLG